MSEPLELKPNTVTVAFRLNLSTSAKPVRV